jgi:lysophospholipase L1-like esterase
MQKRCALYLLTSVLLFSFLAPEKKITVWMIGDSTMSVKETKAYPETGWGMPFQYFFDSTVRIENLAKNGRSTKTFISEGLWKKAEDGMKEGDYLIIQFGHNDEAKEKTDRYTTPEEYKANLVRFITIARSKKVQPILLTPVSRRKFKDGNAVPTHEEYSALVKEVAAQTKVTFIDLDAKSLAYYQQLGEDKSKLMFLQVEPGEHPNYPEGKIDNTHFNEYGARRIAEFVLQGIRENNLPLLEHVVKPAVKK